MEFNDMMMVVECFSGLGYLTCVEIATSLSAFRIIVYIQIFSDRGVSHFPKYRELSINTATSIR
jgi:hypothetical protein